MSERREQTPEGREEDVHDLHDPIVREMERPKDGYQPIPLTLIFLFFGLVGWGGWYVGAYSGGWRVDVMYPGHRPRAAAANEQEQQESEELSDEELVAKGEQVYNQCSSCHQSNGKGVSGSFPPLDGSKWVTGAPELPIRVVLDGLQGSVEVKGETYDGQMPAWGEQLSDREIASVVSYIRQSWSNDAPVVEPSVVGEVRSATSDRQEAWTASDLDELTN